MNAPDNKKSYVGNEISLALIGLGQQTTKTHIPAIKNYTKVKIAAVCDKNLELAQQIGKELNVPYYTDSKMLYEMQKPTISFLALPHDEYEEQIEIAAKYGCNVIKEKPYAIDSHQAKRFEKICKKYSIFILTNVQRRYMSSFVQAKRMLGLIGIAYAFNAKYTINIEDPSFGWRSSKKKSGGGCIIDMGYHLIDALFMLFGTPSSVSATFSKNARPQRDYDVEDTATLQVQYSSGLHGIAFISRCCPPKTEFIEIYGTLGKILIEKEKMTIFDNQGRELQQFSSSQKQQEPTHSLLDEAISHFTQNTKPLDHYEHAIFVDACYKSIDIYEQSIKKRSAALNMRSKEVHI